MKVGYIVALLMIVLMVGCATTEPEAPPAAPEAPAAEPETPPMPEAPVEEVEAPAAEEPAAEVAGLTDAQKEHVERLKASCEGGSIQLCLVLKNTYGIEMEPGGAEEPAADEPATE